jgi:cytochrome c-type biogenesis protein CcmH
MKTFVIIAALMAAIAAAAVALPLLLSRRSRIVGLLAAALISAAAAGLYPLWSNWDWSVIADEKAAPDPAVAAMVGKLEQHLKDQPGDLAGWLMMGRSYLALERAEDAVIAFQHAYSLSKNADTALGLGEALSVRAGGDITPQASQLFEEAIALAPDDPKALFYGGFAAAIRGDTDLARQRWQALKDLHPPPQIEQMLDARMAELGPAPGGGTAAGAAGPAGPGTNSSAGGTNASAAVSAAARVNVNISIAPELKARVTNGAPLFVFAREPGGAGPPLAAKRLTTAAIGTQVSLSAADSMIPGRVLSSGQKVSITARISFSGQPTPAAGDLYGEASYEVGSGADLNLVIDRVAGDRVAGAAQAGDRVAPATVAQ